MKKLFVEDWTEKEYEEGNKYAKKILHDQLVKCKREHPHEVVPADGLCTAYVSTDALPGIKLIANASVCQNYEGAVVRDISTRALKFIPDSEADKYLHD